MELTEGSETSANHNLTPGKYPKEHIQYCVYVSKVRVKNQEDVIDITEVVHKFVFAGQVGKVCVFDVLKKDF
jgi:hypothetical protein